MKIFNCIISVFLTALIFSSCQDSSLQSFSSPSQIYFYDVLERSSTVKDSILISFARLEAGTKETIVEIPLRYIGPVADVDRPFKVTVDREGTTAVEGKHFVLLPELSYIKKGKDKGKLPIKIISTPDLDDNMVQIVLKLVPNENFNIDFHFTNSDLNVLDLSRYRVLFSNKLLKPSWWGGTSETSYLGSFSMKKVEAIYQVTKMDLDDIEEAILKYDWDLLKAIARETQVYINYQRSIGEEIIDENNQPINMGTYVN